MFKKSVGCKIQLSIVGSAALVLIMVTLVTGKYFSYFYVNQKSDELVRSAQEIVAFYTSEEQKRLDQLHIQMSSTMRGAVVDTDGNIVATVGYMGQGRGMQRKHIAAMQGFWSAALTGIRVQKDISLGDESMLLVAEPIIAEGAVLGAVILYAPLEPIDKAIAGTLRVVYGVGALGVVLSFVVANALSKYITKPLRMLHEGTEELRAGNYAYELDIRADDELGKLGVAFNELSQRLNTTISSLQAEKERLARLLQQRRQFVANIAHELRTPLSIIKGYAEAVQDDVFADDNERDNYLGIIGEETSRLHGLVGELLVSAKYEHVPVDIGALMVEVGRKLSLAAEQNDVKIRIKSENDLVANGVEEQIYRVLVNFVHNAIKYSYKETYIVLYGKHQDNAVFVGVRNRGPALSEEEIEQVFNRFYRGDRVLHSGGTGLGLAISKDIIENHGGEVGVTSSTNDGTEFYFILPK